MLLTVECPLLVPIWLLLSLELHRPNESVTECLPRRPWSSLRELTFGGPLPALLLVLLLVAGIFSRGDMETPILIDYNNCETCSFAWPGWTLTNIIALVDSPFESITMLRTQKNKELTPILSRTVPESLAKRTCPFYM